MRKYSFKVFDFNDRLVVSMVLNKEDVPVFTDIYDVPDKYIVKVYALDDSEVK